jgi:hypothetical protein
VTFANTLDSVSGQNYGLTVSGAAEFDNAVGGNASLSALDVTGATTMKAGTVTTIGAQTYGGAMTLGAATTLASQTSPGVDGTGMIDFVSTINGGYALAVNTAGPTIFGGLVGNLVPLTSVTTDQPGTVDIDASVKTSGAQTYNELTGVTLAAGAIDLSGSNVTFAGPLDGPADLTVTGNVILDGPVGGTTKLSSLEVTGTSALNGGTVTTTGGQSYDGAVTLGENTTLASLTSPGIDGTGAVKFASTVDGTTNGGQALTVDTAGLTSFGGVVGGGMPLASVTTDQPGTVAIDASVTTTGAQTYNELNGATLAAGTIDLTGSEVSFAGPLNGPSHLTVMGNAVFDGAVGGAMELSSLEVTGATALNTGKVTTTGDQLYDGPVTLSKNTTLASQTSRGVDGTGTVEFASTVDGAVSGGQALVVDTAGPTIFNGVVGGHMPLASVFTDQPGSVALNSGSITTTGSQNYNELNVTVGVNTTLTSTGGVVTLGSNATGDNLILDFFVPAPVSPTQWQTYQVGDVFMSFDVPRPDAQTHDGGFFSIIEDPTDAYLHRALHPHQHGFTYDRYNSRLKSKAGQSVHPDSAKADTEPAFGAAQPRLARAD